MAKKVRYEIFYLLSGRTVGFFCQKIQAIKHLEKYGFRRLYKSKKAAEFWFRKRDGRFAEVRILKTCL